MSAKTWSPLELRELHLAIAVQHEADSLGAEGDLIELHLDKITEALSGAEYFERLYLEGVSVVTRARS